MTAAEWYQHIAQTFVLEEIENPFQEAKWLLAGALDQDSSFLILKPTYQPSAEEEVRLQDWMNRRLKGEPLSRLKGVREFWSLPFHLNEHTLDPRPDSESLVEGTLSWLGRKTVGPLRVLDLGTGTGCLLIALLHECPQATGLGVDLSAEALEMAYFNATLNKVAERANFLKGNWGENLEGSFDVIISNPPYISCEDKEKLSKSVVEFDPHLALFAGEDGLDAYRTLHHDMKRLLSPQGFVALEVGYGQCSAVALLFQEAGFEVAAIFKDLAGIERGLGLIFKTEQQ